MKKRDVTVRGLGVWSVSQSRDVPHTCPSLGLAHPRPVSAHAARQQTLSCNSVPTQRSAQDIKPHGVCDVSALERRQVEEAN